MLSLLFSRHAFLEELSCNSWAKVLVASCVLAAADSLDGISKRDFLYTSGDPSAHRVTQVRTHVNWIAFGHDACQ